VNVPVIVRVSIPLRVSDNETLKSPVTLLLSILLT
jgi:hypothetical protein